jgi:hypothetical protein
MPDNERRLRRRGTVPMTRVRNLSAQVGRFRFPLPRVCGAIMKRIFMISSHPLFGEGVEALLRQLGGIEVVGREADIDSAIAHIKELRPEVVIVDDGCPACDARIIVMRVLREQPGTKVVGLNLKDNTLCIYREEQRIAHGVEDLKSAIVDGGTVQPAFDHEIGKEEN